MKIKVKEIPASGLNLSKTVSSEEIGLDDKDIGSASPIEVTAKIDILGDTVLAKTKAKTTFSFICSRCLKSFEKPREEEYHFDYLLDKSTESIDLGEDIRQEIILGLPQKFLCREDCKGMCSSCGVDLNSETCSCKDKLQETKIEINRNV